jgi:ABC-2 type transport system ATP-binding protein/lipopolysaccharide transport system ATP-binding protein
MVSHDLDTVLEMADEVIWLEKGKIKMLGSPKEVVNAYRTFEL